MNKRKEVFSEGEIMANPIRFIFDKIFNKKIKINDTTEIKAPRKMLYWGKFNRYPVLCLIFEKRGQSYLIDFDWAGYFKTPQHSFYRLKRRKANFMPPDLQQVKMTPDGQPVMILWSPSRNQFIPRDVIENLKVQEILDLETNMRYWGLGELERVRAKSLGFIAKYFPIILFIFLTIIALIGIWVVYDALGEIVVQNVASNQGMQMVIEKLSHVIGNQTVTNVSAPVW